MLCPWCHREMAKGVVQGGREIFFARRPHKFFFRPRGDEILLTEHNLAAPTVEAWCCSICKKIVIGYEPKPKR